MHSVYIAYYKNTNDVNIDRKIKYKETIDKIRNFIIEKTKFFGEICFINT